QGGKRLKSLGSCFRGKRRVTNARVPTPGNTEIEAAVAEVQVPGRVEGVIDRAEHLPIGMRAAAMAAEIAIGGQPKAIAEVAVRAPPISGSVQPPERLTLTPGSRPGLSPRSDSNPQARNPGPISANCTGSSRTRQRTTPVPISTCSSALPP